MFDPRAFVRELYRRTLWLTRRPKLNSITADRCGKETPRETERLEPRIVLSVSPSGLEQAVEAEVQQVIDTSGLWQPRLLGAFAGREQEF